MRALKGRLQAKEIMTPNPATCTRDTQVKEIARMMCDSDCGEIPVVESKDNPKPIGIVTDRDIVCRTLGKGLNPMDAKAKDCMTNTCVTVKEDARLKDCCRLMETNQVRRVLVVDNSGKCVGIVAQADVARHGTIRQIAELLKYISQPRQKAQKAAA